MTTQADKALREVKSESYAESLDHGDPRFKSYEWFNDRTIEKFVRRLDFSEGVFKKQKGNSG